MFLFSKRTGDTLPPCGISAALHLGIFPSCYRQADVTQIPKGPPSSTVANCQPISITPALSKVFERLRRFVLTCYQTQKFASNSQVCLEEKFMYLWCPSVCVSHFSGRLRVFWSTSERLLTESIVREFSNSSSALWALEGLFWHRGIYKEDTDWSVLPRFLSNRSQYIVVDGCRSNLVNVVSLVPHEQYFLMLYNRERQNGRKQLRPIKKILAVLLKPNDPTHPIQLVRCVAFWEWDWMRVRLIMSVRYIISV